MGRKRQYPLIEKSCLACEKPFLYSDVPSNKGTNRGTFCSKKCRQNFQKSMPVERICAYCNNKFIFIEFPSKIEHKRGKFCSRECFFKSKYESVEDKFNRYIGEQKENGCIEWTGPVCIKGYGKISVDGEEHTSTLAHRVSWELTNGPIPNGLNVLHKCDNPPCINPEHLFLGTHQDNSDDKMKKNRFVACYGEKQGESKLKNEEVIEIRRSHAAGELTQVQLAIKHNVSQANISSIICRKIWKHI